MTNNPVLHRDSDEWVDGLPITFTTIRPSSFPREPEKPIQVHNMTFDQCIFEGPMCATLDSKAPAIIQCPTFLDPGHIICVPDDVILTGVITFSNCQFRNCFFKQVQWILIPAVYDIIYNSWPIAPTGLTVMDDMELQ